MPSAATAFWLAATKCAYSADDHFEVDPDTARTPLAAHARMIILGVIEPIGGE
jgi:hypothetical protein